MIAGANVHDTKLLAATLEAVVVERTLAWRSKCRALLVRYDKHAANFRGLLQLACALLWFRRLHQLTLLLAAHVRRGVEERGLALLVVDGTRPLDEMVALVERHFGPLPPGESA